jgi:HEAT repeat protein
MMAFRLPALVLCSLLLGQPSAGREEAGSLDELLAAPCERWSDVPLLQERILELGPEVLPELFQVWAADADEAAPGLDRMREIAVMGALERFPRTSLLSHLEQTSRGLANTAERRAALRLMNRLATPADLSLCLRLAARGRNVELALLEALEECLSLLVSRHAEVVLDLGDALHWAPEGLRVPVVTAIAGPGSHLSLEVLVDQVGVIPRIDAMLLVEIGHLLRAGVPPEEEYLETFRDWLHLRDPAAVELAVRLLGEVHDVHAVPELIELLERDRFGQPAHQALRAITGLNLPRAVQHWRSWYASEEAWLGGEGAERLQQLDARDPRTVAAAIRELAGHPLFADEITSGIQTVLERPEPRIVALACGALGELRARRSIPALVECLEHVDAEVRTAACTSLQKITGLELPPEPEPWRRALDPPLEDS